MRKIIAVSLLVVMVLNCLLICLSINICKASVNTIYVDDGGGQDYTNIQDAINAANSGDTVYVYSGTYSENIVVNKSISLTGENNDTTIITGGGTSNTVEITVDNVVLSHFTIQNSGSADNVGGIKITSSSNTISNCIIKFNYQGIYMLSTSNNNILSNTILANTKRGISLELSSSNNNIYSNKIYDNGGDGIFLQGSSNTITNNRIFSNDANSGIYISQGTSNGIYLNDIFGNTYGILITNGISNNIIRHNNFWDNSENNAKNLGGTNTWDEGVSTGGNYWDDYDGIDGDYDGKGDNKTYSIGSSTDKDNNPFMKKNGWDLSAPSADIGGPYSGVVNINISFDGSGSSDIDGAITDYRWDFQNDGTYDTVWMSSSVYNYSFDAPGTYAVKLQVKDNDDLGTSDITNVEIVDDSNQQPIADAGGPYTGRVNSSIDFNGSSSSDSDGSIVGYRWDFENDGIWDTEWLTTPTSNCTYTNNGTFTVKLEVKDNGSSTNDDTALATVVGISSQQPIADAGGPYTGRVNSSIDFDGSNSSDSDGNIISYNWSFGDSSYGEGINVTHVYPDIGIFNITLTVVDNDGLLDTDSTTASIEETDDEEQNITDDKDSDSSDDSFIPGFEIIIIFMAISITLFLKKKKKREI